MIAAIASEIEAWLTAVGTGLAGMAAIGALVAGWIQFQRSGFTFAVRVLADRTRTRLLVTIENKGRLAGHVAAVRVETPFARKHRKEMRRQGAAYKVVSAKAAPHAAGSRADTVPAEVDLGGLAADLAPGGVLVFRIDLQQPVNLMTDRLMVRFGDGRFVRKRPKASNLSLTPPAPRVQPQVTGASPEVGGTTEITGSRSSETSPERAAPGAATSHGE